LIADCKHRRFDMTMDRLRLLTDNDEMTIM